MQWYVCMLLHTAALLRQGKDSLPPLGRESLGLHVPGKDGGSGTSYIFQRIQHVKFYTTPSILFSVSLGSPL